jgi:sugar (pentulose or hexulose) kinase
MQALWLKTERPETFAEVKHILHFPQYLSYLLTGKIFSEHTSIGCHTALWDFDLMKYHQWVGEEGLTFPDPVDIKTVTKLNINGKQVYAGIGVHDSSSSLAPYFAGSKGKFLLVSTGTWCINMNPFNSDTLTSEELDLDCLCYMSINREPVKSSRLFLGNLHDQAVKKLSEHFKVDPLYYKGIGPGSAIDKADSENNDPKRFFFDSQPYSRVLKTNPDYYVFKSFEDGYKRLMTELADLTSEALDLVLPEKNNIENIYITGGFARNKFFLKLLSEKYKRYNVYTSEIQNGTALGAALITLSAINPELKPELNLGLIKC